MGAVTGAFLLVVALVLVLVLVIRTNVFQLIAGGGIRSVDDMYTMLRAGADKISINSSALAHPDLIRAGAEKFGSQCIVVSCAIPRGSPSRDDP